MLKRPHHTIGADEVHVWHLLADELTDRAALLTLYTLLTIDEQDRMARFRHERDRTLFLLSRGLMRSVLASYLGCRCREVRFAANAFGKPILHADHGPLHFNLTHSRGATALAVSGGREVGIDVEQRGREVEFLALAERFFAPAEFRYLEQLPYDERGAAFFAIWTLKEAFVKGIGRGLTFPLDAFCFEFERNRLLRFRPLADIVSPDWYFHQFDVGERHCGALAVQSTAGGKVHISRRDWRSEFLV